MGCRWYDVLAVALACASGPPFAQTWVVPFYCRRWDETRGDEYDTWGPADYYFWVHDGVLEQQVERYDRGLLLAYDRYHREDQYRKMAVEPLDADEWAPFEIDICAYQRETDGQPFNRPG